MLYALKQYPLFYKERFRLLKYKLIGKVVELTILRNNFIKK